MLSLLLLICGETPNTEEQGEPAEEQKEETKERKVSEYELQLRKENEKRRKENQQLQAELNELRSKLEEYAKKEQEQELSKKDELERERLLRQEAEKKAELLAREKEQADMMIKQLALSQKIKDHATALGFYNPEDALWLTREQLSGLDVQDDAIDTEIKNTLEELLMKKPYLRNPNKEELAMIADSIKKATNPASDKQIKAQKTNLDEAEKLSEQIVERLKSFDGRGALSLYLKRNQLLKVEDEKKKLGLK